ncbi:MAG: rRNA maturation RNase YbeY [Actinomycetota bacterium]|nr:rRNA maturation RNase YbeY [Actinomycetota bacterium]
MDVFVANEQELPVPEARLSDLARHALDQEDVDDDAELSILFVASDHIRRLNERFAGDDYATDVLSFPMMEDEDDTLLLGDVVICPQVAHDNATRLGHSADAELETLLVHGILHLLGYDHDDEQDKKRMDARLSEILRTYRSVSAG